MVGLKEFIFTIQTGHAVLSPLRRPNNETALLWILSNSYLKILKQTTTKPKPASQINPNTNSLNVKRNCGDLGGGGGLVGKCLLCKHEDLSSESMYEQVPWHVTVSPDTCLCWGAGRRGLWPGSGMLQIQSEALSQKIQRRGTESCTWLRSLAFTRVISVCPLNPHAQSMVFFLVLRHGKLFP